MNLPFQKKDDASATTSTLLAIACCVCVCAAVGMVAYLMVARSAPPRRLWSPVVIDASGNQTILGDSRQMEFWTPSVKTKDFLHKEEGEIVATEKWQVIPNDDTVAQFGAVLHSNVSVLGYRRIEVWGQGRTGFKPGWWWTMNVLTNYSPGDLGQSYQAFWKSHQTVFVEVIDNRGRNE